jgi:hypothetical protein
MFNRKQQLSIVGKLLTMVACFVLGVFVLFNMDYIHKKTESEMSPIIMKSLATVNVQNKSIINMEFRKMMIKFPDISSVVLYKFVSDKGTKMYNGQISVTSETRDGRMLPSDDNVTPMVDGTNNIQEILLNNVHYENIATIQLLCETRYDVTQPYSCERYKRNGAIYKSIISIPIVQDVDIGVIGYVMITLGNEYDNLEVQNLVNSLRPNISSIQVLSK